MIEKAIIYVKIFKVLYYLISYSLSKKSASEIPPEKSAEISEISAGNLDSLQTCNGMNRNICRKIAEITAEFAALKSEISADMPLHVCREVEIPADFSADLLFFVRH